MGIKTAGKLLYYRLKKKLFTIRHHERWLSGQPYSSWATIAKRHRLPAFDQGFAILQNNKLCGQIWADELFKKSIPASWHDTPQLYQQADAIADGHITILGFGSFQLPVGTIPWHQDITHAHKSPADWQSAFYPRITIPSGSSSHDSERTHDIKVPWEMSRLHHVFVLGLGYQCASQERDPARMQRYTTAFKHHITDWLNANPLLHGVNWINPMEVAIRAINMVWAFYFFSSDPDLLPSFWERFVGALYDHAIYLEHHWEMSDKPNNHYLANMIGYLYLCSFFAPLIKRFKRLQKRTLLQLRSAWRHQMLKDGICYEGSSAYHALVTEMMLHAILVDKHTQHVLPDTLTTLVKRMHEVTDHLAYAQDSIVHIGDNDSGRIVTGLAHTPSTVPQLKTYEHFGLTIIRQPSWLLTFRHPVYKQGQPTGHFHHDALSFTLSNHQTQLFVDPGTYLYTAHPHARNHLRSAESHNTFFIPGNADLSHKRDLFQLPHQPQSWHATITHNDEHVTIQDHHDGYGPQGLRAWRRMAVNTKDQVITCSDWWEMMEAYDGDHTINSTWVLSLAPGLTVLQQEDTSWLLKKGQRPLATVCTSTPYISKPSFVAPAYGMQVANTLLTSTVGMDQAPMETIIQLL